VKHNFETALEMLLEHEGGYVNHPKDPGGETNLGVTKRTWAKWLGRDINEGEMKELTPEDVAELYKKEYWDRLKCDNLPTGLDFFCFDWGVNSGTGRSAKALQRIISVAQDGAIGPKTLRALEDHNAKEVVDLMHSRRQEFYENLTTFETFGKGWTRRNKKALKQSIKLM
tara:strand:- start:2491 stop:3000 length:510 start_codon:yes stop_codon:yes gene_type:complete